MKVNLLEENICYCEVNLSSASIIILLLYCVRHTARVEPGIMHACYSRCRRDSALQEIDTLLSTTANPDPAILCSN